MKFTKTALYLFLIILPISCDLINPEVKARKLNSLGLQYSDKGNRLQAVQYFLKACNVSGITDSERTIYLENTASEYWNSDADSAKYYYKKAAQLNSRNSYKGLYDMANFYMLNNQTNKALPLLLRAYGMDSVNMQANNLIGLIYIDDNKSEYFNPASALKYNLASYNQYKDVHSGFALAKNYYLLNDMDKALPLFEEVCTKAPGHTPYLGSLAMIYLELGRTEDANRLLAELKQKDLPRYNKIINSNIKTGEHSIIWSPK